MSEPLTVAGCVFCDIIARRAHAERLVEWPSAIAIRPLNPVTDGHALIIPRHHVRNVVDDPATAGVAMKAAAHYAKRFASANIITSIGEAASQTVFHLHLHVVPRRVGDGLQLPWTVKRTGPCRGRCEFHGRLWCKETGRSCEEYVLSYENRMSTNPS